MFWGWSRHEVPHRPSEQGNTGCSRRAVPGDVATLARDTEYTNTALPLGSLSAWQVSLRLSARTPFLHPPRLASSSSYSLFKPKEKACTTANSHHSRRLGAVTPQSPEPVSLAGWVLHVELEAARTLGSSSRKAAPRLWRATADPAASWRPPALNCSFQKLNQNENEQTKPKHLALKGQARWSLSTRPPPAFRVPVSSHRCPAESPPQPARPSAKAAARPSLSQARPL